MKNTQTSTEYKQICNQTISWNDNRILMFICFVGRLLLLASSSSLFIIASFLIQMLNMDKSFFKNWVLHIPHHLRDLLWIMTALSSVAPKFSSLIMGWASSCVCSSQSLLKVITSFFHTFLEWRNPMILGGHSRWLSQFSAFSTSSSTTSCCSLIWETLVKYYCMVSAF